MTTLVLVSMMLCGVIHGQDVISRVSSQLEAEAEVLNSPSCVLFDATLLDQARSEIQFRIHIPLVGGWWC